MVNYFMKYLNISRAIGIFCIITTIIISCSNTYAQKRNTDDPLLTRILFVFDGSQSMYGHWKTGQKIKVAQSLLSDLLDSIAFRPDVELAFRVYGHQSPVISKEQRDCEDTKLEVPFSKNNVEQIKKKLYEITPKGTTPIAYTLEKAAGDFPTCRECRNIIILITDGIEECDGDPCAVSWALQKKGVILKPFVIGMGLSLEIKKSFECVGNYFDASNEAVFKNVLNIVISQVLNSTTVQVNLLDIYGKPTETDVNMTFYEQHSGKIRYNYVHTINHRGNPDTIQIDPLGSYNMVIHTIPPVEKDSIQFVAGKHNVVAVDAPQGALQLKVRGRSDYRSLQCIVRQGGKMETLKVQEFNTTVKYLVGKYDLEVLSLPRIKFDIDIKQSHTNTVEIEQPGIASIILTSRGHASIFEETDNKLELIYTMSTTSTRETLIMQPGRYRVVFRPLSSRGSIYTQEKSFKIESGTSTQIRL